jgi:prepilin-type N-terminal cleavage/methylation domain-containing protein
MQIIIKQRKKGFSLVEVMISTVITGILAVVATSLFYRFISYSNTSISQNNLDSDLRVLIQRLEAEIIPGRKVLATYNPPSDYGTGTISTTSSRLILELPPNGASISSTNKDIAIIEFVPDTTSNLSNSTGNIGKLLFSYIPAPDSQRKRIIKASLNSYVNDKEKSTNSTYASYNMFRFYKNLIQDQGNGVQMIQLQEITNSSEYQNATVIQVKLVLKNKFQGDVYNLSEKESYFRLRNTFGG